MDEYQGSRFKNIGPITIGCMSEEARNLLDDLVVGFEHTYGPDSVHEKSAYSGLYWAVRWSGLIQPHSLSEKAKNDG